MVAWSANGAAAIPTEPISIEDAILRILCIIPLVETDSVFAGRDIFNLSRRETKADLRG